MNGVSLAGLMVVAAQMAVKNSPYPWHVRLGGYRVGLPITDTIPQQLADEWTATMQEAVLLWAEGRTLPPDIDIVDDLDDDLVRQRIAGYQRGYDKEWSRRATQDAWHDFGGQEKERYFFADMPMSLQRAIVSHWDAAHAQWMSENHLVHYAPDFGYHWRISFDDVTVKIKMYDGADKGIVPTQETAENWESRGLPGGMWGWAAFPASEGSNMLWLYVEGVEPPDLSDKGQIKSESGRD